MRAERARTRSGDDRQAEVFAICVTLLNGFSRIRLVRRGRPFSVWRRMIELPPLPSFGPGGATWFGLLFVVLAAGVPAFGREVFDFNADWRFLRGDAPGAAAPGFDDSSWSVVSTPHTFNDIDTFDNWSMPGHRGEQEQWSGRTWYRKSFSAPNEWHARKVFIEFEAARQVAEVYLNGQLLGTHKSGFSPFGFDLTPHLLVGERNVLAVMVDNRFMKDPLDAEAAAAVAAATDVSGGRSTANPNLRQLHTSINETIPDRLEDLQADQIPWNNPHWHPAHGGLYRNVRLHVMDRLHIELPLFSFLQTAGPYAYATGISSQSAQVSVEVPLRNNRAAAEEVVVFVQVVDTTGRTVLALDTPATLVPGERVTVKVAGRLDAPHLWEPAYPHVYRVVLEVRSGTTPIDRTEIPLGVRSVRWDVASGLILNGQRLKLRGWGQKSTNEWPGLGAALPDWLQRYTLALMRAAGGNFVRWGHTAAGPSQIKAADDLGLVTLQPGVDGEHDTVGAAWELRAATFRDVIVYYRNHPSILIWEGGNQKVSREHAHELRALMDRWDPHGGRAYAHRRADLITAEFMDVGIGTEGGREIASLPVVEGEYNREESPRRVWDQASPPDFGYPAAKGMTYQLTSEQFAVNQVEHYVKKIAAPEHGGGANWIFSDSTSGGRVPAEVARASGEVDGVRLPKEAYEVCRVLFREDPQVHIIGHWSYPPKTKKTVYVASNAETVELLVNGRSLGRQKAAADPLDPARYLFTFVDVVFEPGELQAVARRGDEVVAQKAKRTAGVPVALRLTPIIGPDGFRADGADVVLFDVEAIDARGERCPTFEQRVSFAVEGPGVWRGGYNSGRPDSINHLHLGLEAGINRVAVRATREPGLIVVRATADGLRPGEASVQARRPAIEDGRSSDVPAWPAVKMPSERPVRPFSASPAAGSQPAAGGAARITMVGRFTRSFSYSGPSNYIVHVETVARNGKNAYVDADLPFIDLPAALIGADWVQAANKESLFHAVDLMELAVVGGSTITIAHDEELPRPTWLLRQFEPTPERLVVGGRLMRLYQRKVDHDIAITLGANTDAETDVPANMYIVFVQRLSLL
jgi:beta-galactosidase